MTVTEIKDIDERFDKLVQNFPIVDTHNDFPYNLRVQLHNEFSTTEKFNFDSLLTSHTDLVRMRKGKIGIQFFSCWIECKNEDMYYQDFDQPNNIVRDTLEQIDVVQRLVDEYSHSFKFVYTADEALRSFRESNTQKISITLGVEGLHQVDLSLAIVRQYYKLGVRYITLTHNCDNPFATSASSVTGGLPDKGLTSYGRDCVREMNRLGMMVDLSHVSYKTMIDVLEVTQAPVLFSHSSVYALTNHNRNVRDDVLKLVKKNGGVVCINFLPLFLKQKGREDVTIDDAVDHIKHIVDLIGWDHVGFGSDFDGIPQGPVGLEDVSKYPELVKRVWKATSATEEDIVKMMGLNVVRVWKECELVSERLKSKIKPVESNWDQRKWIFYEYCREFPELFPGAYKVKEGTNVFVDTQKLV
jgi:membrane dipeptidase